MSEAPSGRTPPPGNRMAVALLSLVGLFVSLYLLAHSLGITGPVLCGVGDCDTVQASEYAWVGPVPVSGIGVAGYVGLLVVALLGIQPRFRNAAWISLLLVTGAAIGLLFSGWLTYLEAAVINAWCMWCVGSAVLVVLICVATVPEVGRLRR